MPDVKPVLGAEVRDVLGKASRAPWLEGIKFARDSLERPPGDGSLADNVLGGAGSTGVANRLFRALRHDVVLLLGGAWEGRGTMQTVRRNPTSEIPYSNADSVGRDARDCLGHCEHVNAVVCGRAGDPTPKWVKAVDQRLDDAGGDVTEIDA
jgi:hypothetical protein